MDNDQTAIFFFAVIGALGLGIAVLALRQTARKRLARLAPAFELGTSRKVGLFGSAVEGLYKGYTCRYTVQYASQYDPGGALLRMMASSPNNWSAELSNTGTRLLVKFGFAKDFEIGDRELDERFRFSAEDEGVLRSVFGTDRTRDAMHTLAATENFKGVEVRGDHVDIRWAPRDKRLDEEAETVRFRLETATALAGACNVAPLL